MKIYSVSEINSIIRKLIENEFTFVQLQGEISNYKAHYSGHAYFTLKDENSQLSSVMWKNNVERLNFPIEDGKKVICSGQITVFEKTGRYQIIISKMELEGKGMLQLKFEALKEKLFQKGYFASVRKRPLPYFPKQIGIVTSPSGAALQDMISIAQRRNASIQLCLRPCKVQGEGAAEDIAQAIYELNEIDDIDLIIIGRGGGSLEDLWAFNEEIVADAIFNSQKIIISAVGHEIDFSISDFVADFRAATPTAAIEIAIKDMNEWLGSIAYYEDKIIQLVERKLIFFQEKIKSYRSHYALFKPDELIRRKTLQIKEIQSKILLLSRKKLELSRDELNHSKDLITAFNPINVLGRGYTILYQQNSIVDSSKKLENGDIDIQFKDKRIQGRFIKDLNGQKRFKF